MAGLELMNRVSQKWRLTDESMMMRQVQGQARKSNPCVRVKIQINRCLARYRHRCNVALAENLCDSPA